MLVAGGGVPGTPGAIETLVALAKRTRTGVLNTFLAKGLFRFDDPAHLGTIGLQRDDLRLARVDVPGEFTVVVTGVDDDEIPGGIPDHWERVDPGDLGSLHLPDAPSFLGRPELYGAIAAVCGPLYGDARVPLSPVRAAGDLASALGTETVVTANAGLAGFWLGRTFPTRHPGSVRLPVRAGHDVVAEVLASEPAVVVVCGPDDEVPEAAPTGGVVVVEHWSPTGPPTTPADRVAALTRALGIAGVHHLEVGVAVGDVADLVAVAGPIVAWGLG